MPESRARDWAKAFFLSAQADFASPGIDDNCTGERLQLADTLLTLGTAGADYTTAHAADDRWLGIFGGNAVNSGGGILLYGGTHTSAAGDFIFRTGVTNVIAYDHDPTPTLDLAADTRTFSNSAGTEQAQFASDGSLLLGRTSSVASAYKLQIEAAGGGSAYFNRSVAGTDGQLLSALDFYNNGSAKASINVYAEGASGGNIQIGTATTAGTFAERMRVTANGELLLGTTTAAGGVGLMVGNGYIATEAGGSGGILCYDSSNTNPTAYLQLSHDVTGGLINASYSTSGPGLIRIATAGSERMRVASSGQLLINRTNNHTGLDANTKLQVANNAPGFCASLDNAHSSGPYGLYVHYTGSSPNNTGSGFIRCTDSTTIRAHVLSNGGIANFQANDVNLSDERVKTDIADAPSYLEKIKAIPVRTFKYIDQTHDDDNLGVIAQEVLAVAPEFVDEEGWDEDDPQKLLAIYQTDLMYGVMKAVQELAAKVEALENA